MGDESGQQGWIYIADAGGSVDERTKLAAEPTPGVDLAQQRFDPHCGQASLDQTAQFEHPIREFQRVPLMQFQPAFRDRSELVGAHAGRGFVDNVLKFLPQVSNNLIAFAEERQLLVGSLSLSLPAVVAVNQVGEGNVMAAAAQVEGTRTQRVAYGKRQPDLPEAPVDRPIFSFQERVPGGRNEVEGCISGQQSLFARFPLACACEWRPEAFRFRLPPGREASKTRADNGQDDGAVPATHPDTRLLPGA